MIKMTLQIVITDNNDDNNKNELNYIRTFEIRREMLDFLDTVIMEISETNTIGMGV